MGQLCKAIKADGASCSAPVGLGKSYCFRHDPERKEAAKAAQLKGSEIARKKRLGKTTTDSKQTPLKRVRLNTLADVKRFLGKTINEFREQKISVEVAKTTAYICNILISAIKDSEIEGKLRELEERIQNTKVTHGQY